MIQIFLKQTVEKAFSINDKSYQIFKNLIKLKILKKK
jgi:hypothetical protein